MSIAYVLPLNLRKKLKKPLGDLIRGTFDETAKILKTIIENEKQPCIVSVGDIVSKNLVENHVLPRLLIVDNKAMRAKIEPISAMLNVNEEKHVKNPPGTITLEALNAIKEAFKNNKRVKIVVDGEEDLLTLIAILYAPENALIIYGQPHEGVVVVRATKQKKIEVAKILEVMETTAKD